MHDAFRRGGRQAIDKVMKQQPALFLKLLVLLVPRELEVSHSNTIKQMTTEQIEQAIEAIQAMLADRAANAVDVTPKRVRRAKTSPMLPEPAVATDLADSSDA